MVGVAIALVIVLTGVFAPLLAPHDPLEINPRVTFCSPLACEQGGASYVLGTDHLGRDVLSRSATSFRLYLYIGLVGTVLGILAACLLTSVRNIRRIPIDPNGIRPLFGVSFPALAILAYVTGVFASLPPLVALGHSLVVVVGHAGLFSSILPLSLMYEYIGRNRALDKPGKISTVRRAVALTPVLFGMAFLMGLLLESSLSDLGLGVPPSDPSLGQIISSAGAWWIWVFPLGIILVAAGALSAIVFRVGRILAPSNSQC